MIAAAAQRTKYIRLGTGVKSLPFHNPFMLAEAMAQLDHMTRGRAMFGVGPGALPTDVHMNGIEMKDIRHRMDEGLDTIVRADAGRNRHAARPSGTICATRAFMSAASRGR